MSCLDLIWWGAVALCLGIRMLWFQVRQRMRKCGSRVRERAVPAACSRFAEIVAIVDLSFEKDIRTSIFTSVLKSMLWAFLISLVDVFGFCHSLGSDFREAIRWSEIITSMTSSRWRSKRTRDKRSPFVSSQNRKDSPSFVRDGLALSETAKVCNCFRGLSTCQVRVELPRAEMREARRFHFHYENLKGQQL